MTDCEETMIVGLVCRILGKERCARSVAVDRAEKLVLEFLLERDRRMQAGVLCEFPGPPAGKAKIERRTG